MVSLVCSEALISMSSMRACIERLRLEFPFPLSSLYSTNVWAKVLRSKAFFCLAISALMAFAEARSTLVPSRSFS
ncbi:hypothetical protein ASF94_17230 [Acidovorax sp. Leaf160]|nr:hypothetical protein ASF94_17230 [Acidovorax sp. Leaf160]